MLVNRFRFRQLLEVVICPALPSCCTYSSSRLPCNAMTSLVEMLDAGAIGIVCTYRSRRLPCLYDAKKVTSRREMFRTLS